MSTDEGSPADDDSYLGYSVATGEFNGDNDMDIAVGMPRGANLTGKVSLARFPLPVLISFLVVRLFCTTRTLQT